MRLPFPTTTATAFAPTTKTAPTTTTTSAATQQPAEPEAPDMEVKPDADMDLGSVVKAPVKKLEAHVVSRPVCHEIGMGRGSYSEEQVRVEGATEIDIDSEFTRFLKMFDRSDHDEITRTHRI